VRAAAVRRASIAYAEVHAIEIADGQSNRCRPRSPGGYEIHASDAGIQAKSLNL